MDDINLFIEISSIKQEIQNDLHKMDKISNDLDLQAIYESNQELSNKIYHLNQNCTSKIENFKNQNNKLEKEILRLTNLNHNQEAKIKQLTEENESIKAEKEQYENTLLEEEAKYANLQNELITQKNFNSLIEENKAYINSLFN